jgi:hypothetical protein
MTSANEQAYGHPNWTTPGDNAQRSAGGDRWNGWHFGPGHPVFGPFFPPKPVLIIGMILGFVFWWPIGLGILAFLIWSKAMCRSGYRRFGGDAGGGGPWTAWKNWHGGGGGGNASAPSGNRAFDEYRAETLQRLEEEQKEFGEFLDRLRFAKDKSEFDQFMSERRNRPETPPEPPKN